MKKHFGSKHPGVIVPSKYIISEFECKSVEYIRMNGYLPDNKYKSLYSSYRNETLEVFGDREKEKKDRKRRKQWKRRKQLKRKGFRNSNECDVCNW